ncbi:hypothetical protein BX600DRAFT_155967 [Xylariales sp. PMI_506]|nr:hypothetical protein BX600DRAFT_155967 [Xylariales sp. PMI_506]
MAMSAASILSPRSNRVFLGVLAVVLVWFISFLPPHGHAYTDYGSPKAIVSHNINSSTAEDAVPAEAPETTTSTSTPAPALDSLSDAFLPSYAEVKTYEPIWAKIGKVTMLYYNDPTKDSLAYEKALLTHQNHDNLHHYRHYVMRREVVPGMWAKIGFLLSIMLQELEKSPSERLEWLFWHDSDLILMNSKIPLEAFLPPHRWSHIHVIGSNDLNGLNAGVFFIRVHEWSVSFLMSAYAYKDFYPGVPLPFAEQTAMEILMAEDKRKKHAMHVPQRWFNSYQGWGHNEDVPPEWEWDMQNFKPGYLLLHLPGTGSARSDLIDQWVGRIQEKANEYEIDFSETHYPKEIGDFWDHEAQFEEENQKRFKLRQKALSKAGYDADRATEKAIAELRQSLQGQPEETVRGAVRAKEKEYKQRKIENLREAERVALMEELNLIKTTETPPEPTPMPMPVPMNDDED